MSKLNPKHLQNGHEQYQMFQSPYKKKEQLCQYDYRDMDGVLFSCVTKSLEQAQQRKDEWIQSKEIITEKESTNHSPSM